VTSAATDTALQAPTDTGAVPAATVLTEYDNMDFMPADIVIAVGDTVEFVMHRSHNAIEVSQETYELRGRTPLEGGFAIDYGTTALVTFTEAGTHYYVCQPHASVDMVGTIIVEP
jgi:plastocyanin